MAGKEDADDQEEERPMKKKMRERYRDGGKLFFVRRVQGRWSLFYTHRAFKRKILLNRVCKI